nr:cation transporter dimerization domain-containing protein [uncultured Peptostreptococcus sp.]
MWAFFNHNFHGNIYQIYCEEGHVRDAHDLFLFNYGSNKNYASVHIELPDTMKVDEVDILTRRIQRNVYYKTGVILTGIGVYAHKISSDQAVIIRESVEDPIMKYDWAPQMHGFLHLKNL